MNKYYLLELNACWADEFDVKGISLFDEETLEDFHKILDKTSFPKYIGFGTNEDLHYYSKQDVLGDITIREIPKEAFDIIDKYVGDFGTLTPMDLYYRLSEDTEEEEEEDE